MPYNLDAAVFTASSGGTGSFTVSAALTGYRTPVAAGAVDGRTYRYRAQSADLSQWEVGTATASSTGTVFSRTVLFSSTGGTVNFTLAPTVAITITKADILQFEESMSLTANQKAQGRANIDVLKKNYIINGAMMVSQENGTTAGTATGYYPVDQFNIVSSGTSGTYSVAQVASTTPGGSPNRARVTVTAADASVAAGDLVYLTQKIEGLRVADLLLGTSSAKTITIQFGVKAPAGTYCVELENSANNRSYIAEYVISGGEANTDVIKSVTIALDQSGTWLKDTGLGLHVKWGLMVGANAQNPAGSWAAVGNVAGTSNQFNLFGTNGNVFELFDVGLYEGSAAPLFMMPNYDSELASCKRYLWRRTFNATGGNDALAQLACYTTTACWGKAVDFPVEMRAGGTTTVSSVSHFHPTNAGGGVQNVFTGMTFNANTKTLTATGFTGSNGLVAGNVTVVGVNTTSAWVMVNSRL